MKYINIISLIIITLLFSSCNNNELDKGNDAIYKSIKKIYTLNSDGSVNYQYQHELKYITHVSFNRLFGESFIIYNPEQQELKINKAETKMVDGTIVPSPENAFNEVLPYFADGVPAYNHFREMVVTHTGLETGCTVSFDYEINSKAGYLPYFSENIILQEIVPVENLEIIVNVPDNTTLNFKLVNAENEAIVTQKEGFTQYKWKFKDLEDEKFEANQANDQSFLPRLIFSSVSLNDAISNLYTEDDLILSDDIKNQVRRRIFGIKNGISIIRKLQKIVGKELNDINIPIEYSNYSIRPLNEVWNSNSGTNSEKIILLNEFIKYIGFESKLLVAIPPSFYDKYIGCLSDFGHFYIQVNVDGEDLIISTNPGQSNNLAFELKDAGILGMDGNSVNLPDFVYDLESSISTSGNLKIDESGTLTGKINLNVQGIKNPYLNYLEDMKNAKEIATTVFPAKAITDFKVIQFDNLKSEIEAQIEEKEVWKNQGDYYFVDIPSSNYGIKGEHIRTLLNERETPFVLSYPINELYGFDISVPDGFNLIDPIKKELNNELGSVKIEISLTENILHVIKSIQINKAEINPVDYDIFKNLVDIWNKKTYNEIILKKL